MKVVFRVDASVQMGTGHLMRCLTLAEALRECDARIGFVCREHVGNLISLLRQKGFAVTALPAPTINDATPGEDYAVWLGATQAEDAEHTIETINGEKPDWLVVDHYGLDVEWEHQLRRHVGKVLVIDDLANRKHDCDVLLDQNWFVDKSENRYDNLVKSDCVKLLGPEYALLKPEYAALRALISSRNGEVNRVLVFMGGSDPTNETTKVLNALMLPSLKHLAVDVVIGMSHPFPEVIRKLVASHPKISCHENLPNLASLMAQADLMVSAGGSTTWERMCLGLPAVVISIAENQTETNQALMKAGYINFLGEKTQVSRDDIVVAITHAIYHPEKLKLQSERMQALVSGEGAKKVSCKLYELLGQVR